MFTAGDPHLNTGESQPVARAPIGPPVDPFLTIKKTSNQHYRGREDQQQRRSYKP